MTSPESPDAPLPPPTDPTFLNVDDALAFLDSVKSAYRDHPDVYERFLDLMSEFRRNSVDTSQMIDRSVDLFQDHAELLEGLGHFLPPGYQLEVTGGSVTITTPLGATTRSL